MAVFFAAPRGVMCGGMKPVIPYCAGNVGAAAPVTVAAALAAADDA